MARSISDQVANRCLRFHRPLNLIMRPFLNVGWILDALEDPTFPVAEAEGRFFSWAHFSEFPPVLAMRLRHDSSKSRGRNHN